MYLACKRLIDILFSLLAIVILSPIFIPIVILLLLTGEREIFYLQPRVGHKRKFFNIIKFATMLKNSPNIGNGDVTLRNDPRVTKVGVFLRSSKINELPQLINILRGDISIVGPRPLMEAGFNRYEQKYKKSIYNIKPGLTGIGSILFRDEEKIITNSKLSPHECYEKIILPVKGEVELWYQKNMSIFVDIKLMVLTFLIIIFPNSGLHNRWFKDLPELNLHNLS
jgi:lipopolysaccharide/colanic/teichoic acid biosynthesis glycosyltransferase